MKIIIDVRTYIVIVIEPAPANFIGSTLWSDANAVSNGRTDCVLASSYYYYYYFMKHLLRRVPSNVVQHNSLTR